MLNWRLSRPCYRGQVDDYLNLRLRICLMGGRVSEALPRSMLNPPHFQVHADAQIKQCVQRPKEPHAQHGINNLPCGYVA
jgi:hypothetical protein